EIKFTGQGELRLTAPTSGPYQGISVFQDRDVSVKIEVTGHGAAQLNGVVYAPAAEVKLTGNGALGTELLGGAWVVNTMKIAGNGNFSVALGVNRPKLPEVGLVE